MRIKSAWVDHPQQTLQECASARADLVLWHAEQRAETFILSARAHVVQLLRQQSLGTRMALARGASDTHASCHDIWHIGGPECKLSAWS